MPEDSQQPGWTYKPGDKAEPGNNAFEAVEPAASDNTAQRHGEAAEEISWTASEFVANQKNFGWYLGFIVGIAAVSGFIFLFTKDVISAAVIGFAGLLFIILAARKPRELPYKVDSQGITIGGKFYPYTLFKSFGLAHEGMMGAINLLPLKRFMPEVSIYYPPEEENKILDIIADHLPHEQREEHSVDRLLKKIRF